MGVGIAAAIGVLAPVIAKAVEAVIQIFSAIGGGCGAPCTDSAKLEQVFEVAAYDLLVAYDAGMVPQSDMYNLLQLLLSNGVTAFAQLPDVTTERRQTSVNNMTNAIDEDITHIESFSPNPTQLLLNIIQTSFLNPLTAGYYPDSIVAGNGLAFQILQTYQNSGLVATEVSPLAEAYSNILSSLSQNLQQAQAASGHSLANILAGIAGLTSAASGLANDTSDQALATVLGYVGLSQSTTQSIANDISTVAGDISSALKYVNTNVIQGIINPTIQAVQQQSELATSIEGDLKNGITGILQIPAQFANAISSQAATSKANIELSNAARESVATNITVPGIGGVIGAQVSNVHQTLQNLTEATQVGLTEPPSESFSGGINSNTIAAYISDLQNKINTGTHWYDALGKDVYHILVALEFIVAQLKPMIAQAEIFANQANPVQPISANLAAQAVASNLLDDASGQAEANANGLSNDRWKLLTELAQQLLDPDSVVNAWIRGILSPQAAQAELERLRYTPDRINVLKELATFIPDMTLATAMYVRGAIDEPTLEGVLADLRWSPGDIAAWIQIMLEPASASETTKYQARAAEASKGFLAQSLTTQVPPDVASQYFKTQRSNEQAKLDWLAHWQDIDIYAYLNALWRGLITRDTFNSAWASQNFPAEASQMFVDASRPLISFFYLVEMLAAGVYTHDEAAPYLSRYGFEPDVVDKIIKYADFKQRGAATEQNTALAQLSVSTIVSLYDKGILTGQQLLGALISHGYDEETAGLLVQLYETKTAATAQTQYADGLVAQVKAGLLDSQTAIDDLAGRGYTATQIASYQVRILDAKVANNKLPTEAQLNAMLKNGIIDEAMWLQTMQQLGFSALWAGNLLKLV